MANGDWVTGTQIELSDGSQVSFGSDASMTISLSYWVVPPSGDRIFITTPYPYQADIDNSIGMEFNSAVEELANQEGIGVQVTMGAQVSLVMPEAT